MDFEQLYFKMIEYKKHLVIGGLSAIALITGVAFYPAKKEQVAFLHGQAAESFIAWAKDPVKQGKEYKKLTKLMGKHPQINQWYVGPVVQRLTLLGKGDQARKLYGAVVEREGISECEKFSMGSFDSAAGKLKRAAEKTATLSEAAPLMKAFSLIRTAMIFQALKRGDLELGAWTQFRQFSNTVPHLKKEIDRLLPQSGNRSIFEYIKEREAVLTHSH